MDSNFTRRRFLETSAALLGVSIIGCGPQEAATPVTNANSDGSVTLTGVGTIAPGSAVAFTFPNGEPGLIFTTQEGKTGALSAKCTHAGCIVEWNGSEKAPLRCPCHESEFTTEGKVLGGPAKGPLPAYAVTRSGDKMLLKPI